MAKRLYQLRNGETLKTVAKSQLGDESRWSELAYINSLNHPYFVTPGQLILVPDDTDPLEVVVTTGTTAPTATPPAVAFDLSPTQWGLVAAGVVLIAWIWKR